MPKTVRHVSSSSTRSDYVRYAPSTILKAGTPDQKVSITEFRDHPVILAFYPADWSPVCGDEMTLFNEILPEFEKFDPKIESCNFLFLILNLKVTLPKNMEYTAGKTAFQNVLCL